jgi:hypothetical protein
MNWEVAYLLELQCKNVPWILGQRHFQDLVPGERKDNGMIASTSMELNQECCGGSINGYKI